MASAIGVRHFVRLGSQVPHALASDPLGPETMAHAPDLLSPNVYPAIAIRYELRLEHAAIVTTFHNAALLEFKRNFACEMALAASPSATRRARRRPQPFR